MKKLVLLSFAVATVLLILMVSSIGLQDVAAAFAGINPLYIPVIVLIPLCIILIFAFRWMLLLRSVGLDVSFRVVFKHTFIGSAFNNITPILRFGGEPVRIYLLSDEVSAKRDRVVASVAIDSIITAVSLIVLAYFGTVSLAMLKVLDWFSLWLMLTMMLLPLTLGIYGFCDRRLFVKIARFTTRIVSRMSARWARKMTDNMMSIRENMKVAVKERGIMYRAVILGFAERFLEVLCIYVIMNALGFDIGLQASAVVIGIGIIAGAIPLFPGGLVLYESSVILVLGLFGVPAAVAAIAVLLYRITNYWMITLIGLSMGWLHGVRSS